MSDQGASEQVVWLDEPPPEDEGCERCWGRRPAEQGAAGGCRWCEARAAPEWRIVWVEDISRLDYVRESNYDTFSSRARRPAKRDYPGRLVGYSELKPEAEPEAPGYFRRRVFWLKDYDRDSEPGGVYRTGTPSEAVDPRTVAPNVRGHQTARSWGGTRAGEQGPVE
jgi:hypothetical protein